MLDRHPSHYCEKNGVRRLLRQQFDVRILPRASSWYNSSEWLFPHLKRAVRLHFIQREGEVVSMDQFAKEVAVIATDVSARLRGSRVFFANVGELRKALD